MRAFVVASAVVGLALAGGLEGCSPPAKAPAADPLSADQALIAQAQKASDAVGGCQPATASSRPSRVVTLEKNKIVLLSCTQNDVVFTVRLFAANPSGVQILPLPDYEGSSWFATDQASMAELDAGTGVLTTQRLMGGKNKESCGSEGRYQWNGVRFDLQEMRWQACGDKNVKQPPFPVVWPANVAAAADLADSAPSP